MAAIQEGKVNFSLFSFFWIFNFEHFLRLKFIWSPCRIWDLQLMSPWFFYQSEYSQARRKRSLFGGREEDWTKPGNFNKFVEFFFLVCLVDEIAVCRVFVFVVQVDGPMLRDAHLLERRSCSTAVLFQSWLRICVYQNPSNPKMMLRFKDVRANCFCAS